jgi:putative ABC transport system substrate-binding protein
VRRRQFITIVGGAAAAWPLAARAQQPGERIRRIGVLQDTAEGEKWTRKLWLVGGATVRIDYRFAAAETWTGSRDWHEKSKRGIVASVA